jgi:hypothetical protein
MGHRHFLLYGSSIARFESTVEGLPTWCPDFSNSWSYVHTLNSNINVTYWGRIREALKSIARVDCDCSDMSIRFAGIHLGLVSRCVGNSPLFSSEDAFGTIAEQDVGKAVLFAFSERNMNWLGQFYTSSMEWRDSPATALRYLNEFFTGLSNTRFTHAQDLTPERLQRLHNFTAPLRHRRVVEQDEPKSSTPWSECPADTATMDMWKLLVRFNGSYVFETTTGNMGFCYKPISPGDIILLVPAGGLLHAVSADRCRYIGVVHVQGWTEYSILQLLPELEQRLEMFCVS